MQTQAPAGLTLVLCCVSSCDPCAEGQNEAATTSKSRPRSHMVPSRLMTRIEVAALPEQCLKDRM